MPDLADGESVSIQGSAPLPYTLKNVGRVYSCSCPAWRNQSLPIERRTCKHLRAFRGEQAERERLGGFLSLPARPAESAASPPAAPGFLLAERSENDRDLTGWWISEKLDGVRAWWDGQGRFLSRQGNEFQAPTWFTAGLPKMPLDGELWLDRKAFQRTVSIVRRHDEPDEWRRITFMVFDAPLVPERFESRQALIEEALREQPPFARIVEQDFCDGVDHLRSELARVEALGGEGLMLREPGSRYEPGRSATLLKMKTFHDAEARVMAHAPGRGRHRGRVGALLVELPGGVRFHVGTGFTDAQRERPPAVGSIITFRFQELNDAGVPRFPSFVRLATSPL